MRKSDDREEDYVLGLTNIRPHSRSGLVRQDATIMSLICSDLFAMWKSGDLALEIVLERIEEMADETTDYAISWMKIQYVRIEVDREMQLECEDSELL